MKTLLLLRGAPGCGKSTFIEQNGLKPYALSADDLRMLVRSPSQATDGTEEIVFENEKDVWNILYKLLEIRMESGEFTVIDATNSKTSEMNKYKELCDNYRYRMFCIDFTDLPIEECKRRNASRPKIKQVPEDAIDKMYARFRTQKIPSGIKVLKPDQLDQVWMHKFDMSKYDKIVHIGDVHGAYTALMEYFKDGFKDNYFYIFVGDYTDRGIENADVVKFIMGAVERPNVLCLTGNHCKWLWLYAHDCVGKSKEFELFTRKQLDEAQIDKKLIRKMMRKFGQAAWYTYGDKEILVTHAGIATMPENLTLIATKQFIHGVGEYKDSETIADTWVNTTADNMYQIHGHRNIKNVPMKVNDRVYNLEGKVEFGGHLRILELDADGFHEVEIKNNVFCPPIEVEQHKEIADSPISDVVLKLRANKYVQEKEFGHISSFNFTSSAFYDKIWDAQTIQARGLYIDTERMKVAARGFSKFFNINERPETKFEMLQHKFQFPVTCYVKENGFLGLISYDIGTDDLFITTKSTPEGTFAQWLKEMFERKVSAENRERIKQYCKEYDVTFVFECVDMEHDPHIIDYPESELYLLSIVRNVIKFEQMPYANMCQVANDFGLKTKTLACEIANWSDFVDWYNDVMDKDYEFNGRIIEGFVIEDSSGFMTKCKLTYYNFWKFMRGIAHETLRRGYIPPAKTSALTTDTANKFYGFCKMLYEETPKEERENLPKDIITLRKMFETGYRDLY